MPNDQGDDWLALSDPDIGTDEMEQALLTLRSPQLSMGPKVAEFEGAFAAWVGRPQGVAVSSGTLGACLLLKAWGVGAGDEVITTGYAWHQVAHAIALVGVTPVLVDIDYWSGCIDPASAERAIGPRTRVLLAGNVNGHPADWAALRSLADRHGLKLLEDSTEAIGSRYQGRHVGTLGDAAAFDFSQPSAPQAGRGLVPRRDAELRGHQAALPGRSGRRGALDALPGSPGQALHGQCAQPADRRHGLEQPEHGGLLPAPASAVFLPAAGLEAGGAAQHRTHRRPLHGVALPRAPRRRPRPLHRQDAQGCVGERGRGRGHLPLKEPPHVRRPLNRCRHRAEHLARGPRGLAGRCGRALPGPWPAEPG